MRIPPFWSRQNYETNDGEGRLTSTTAYGWSFSSLQDAAEDALTRAKRVIARLESDVEPDRYEYGEHPIREEIVDTVNEQDQPVAIITRNRYGALVLNTKNVLFADIDLPQSLSTGILDAIKLLFSSKNKQARRRAFVETIIEDVEQWAAAHPGSSLRIYRTHSGVRLLFTDKLYDPTSDETFALLQELNCDPLYTRLTKNQECFRARLTPKPWRCDCRRPGFSYPWDDDFVEKEQREWEVEYEQKIAGYKTCELIKEIGRPPGEGLIRAIVAIHDQQTLVEGDGALA